MKYVKQHKYRFGVSGNPLKSFFGTSKLKEKRVYPWNFNGTMDYVKNYF